MTGRELDRSVRSQLRTLSIENAEGVAQHLVMVAMRLDEDDIDAAMAHAETAVRRGGRVPATREALGMVAYRQGDFARALSEFRTARRLSGSDHVLPIMADCERGLGRPEKALELVTSAPARALTGEDAEELAIVTAGIRRDQGLPDAAKAILAKSVRRAGEQVSARLAYAYADTLEALDDTEGAQRWFTRAAERDEDLQTDAVERLELLLGSSGDA